VQLERGRLGEAATLQREALEIARVGYGPDHQLPAIYTINLGAIELASHRPAAAEPLLREGLRLRSKLPGVVPSRRRTRLQDDWSIAAITHLLGASLAAQGRDADAAAR
jgi:hypothetical protein